MTRTKPIFRACATLLLFVVAGASTAWAQDQAAPDMEAINAARGVAVKWLALLDAGDYEETWSQAASPVQNAVSLADWMTSLQDTRGPLEPFGERTLVDSRDITDPAGAPPGNYVFLHYRTQVAQDQTATETIVLVDEDDVWKVIGYFVQPGEQAGG